MVHYLNDLDLWNRQGERHLRESRNETPAYPQVAAEHRAALRRPPHGIRPKRPDHRGMHARQSERSGA
jgi:hypothetical protein